MIAYVDDASRSGSRVDYNEHGDARLSFRVTKILESVVKCCLRSNEKSDILFFSADRLYP